MKIFNQYKGLRKELYVLFIGRIMTNMGAMVWPMFTLILSQKIGLSASQIATYTIIYSIIAIPLNLLGGKLADKYNKKNIIVVFDIISVVGYVYCFLVPITFQSIILFLVASLFQSMEYPSYEALLSDFTTSEDRDRAFSLSYLGNNLGLVLSPTIAGILFNKHLNLSFLISGMSILLSTILIFIFVKDTHREVSTSETAVYEKELDNSVSAFAFLKSCRVIFLSIFVSVFYNAVYNMWSFIMPMDMVASHGETGSVLYGTITSVNCIQVVVCTAFVTTLLAKIRDLNRMTIGSSLVLVGFAIFAFFQSSIVMCYVAIIVFTFGEIIHTISQPAFVSRRIPASHRGRINSISAVTITITNALLQKGVAVVYDKTDSITTWLTIIGLGLVGIMLLEIVKKFDKKDFPAFYKTKA